MPTIIVGIDGSESSRAALAWAIHEARLREATIDAIMTWHIPYVGGATMVPLGTVDFDPVEMQAWHQVQLDQIVQEVVGDSVDDATNVEIRAKVVLSSVTPALLEAAQGADLLVVGSRGLGGFKGLVLGSVTHQIIGHAPCPVVVIPPPGDEPEDATSPD